MDVQDFIVNRDQHMRPLEYDLSENFNELVRYLNDMGVLGNVPVGVTAESEIASVSDAYPAPPRALTVFGKSTQDGTPTPDAPVPIESVDDLTAVMCGKNLCGGNALLANMQTAMPQVATGSDESGDYLRFTGAMAQDMPSIASGMFKPSAQYTFIVKYVGEIAGAQSQIQIAYTDGTTTAIGVAGNPTGTAATAVVVSVAGKSVKELRAYWYSGATRIYYNQCGIFEGVVTAADYAPYIGTTVPDLLPEGTSLRSLPDGTKDTLNLAYLRPSTRSGWAWYSRELVQSAKELSLAIADMTDVQVSSSLAAPGWEDTGISDGFTTASAVFANTKCLCNISNNSRIAAGYQTHNRLVLWPGPEYGYEYTTAAEWKTAYPNLTFVLDYPLATPITTQLDPIELPQLPAPTATVWCDGGSATPTLVLEYVRDASATIAELSEAIADIVSD